MPREFDITSLTPAERILLAEQLWDSVADSQDAPPLTDAQRAELQRRLEASDRGDLHHSTWDQVKRRLLGSE